MSNNQIQEDENEQREQGYYCPECESTHFSVGWATGGRKYTGQKAQCDDCKHIWAWVDPSIEANIRAYGN